MAFSNIYITHLIASPNILYTLMYVNDSYKDIFSFLKYRGAVMGFSNRLVPGVAEVKVAEKVTHPSRTLSLIFSLPSLPLFTYFCLLIDRRAPRNVLCSEPEEVSVLVEPPNQDDHPLPQRVGYISEEV